MNTPSHEPHPPADPVRRAHHRRLCAGLLAAGLAMMGTVTGAAQAAQATVPLPAPPAGAQAVDWDHFGEPTLSAARRANVAASAALQPGSGQRVDTQLYRLPGEADWAQVLGHYRQGAAPAWQPRAGSDRLETGNPARQQQFSAAADAGQRLAIVWLPATGEVRDGLLMVLRTLPAR